MEIPCGDKTMMLPCFNALNLVPAARAGLHGRACEPAA
jgi:hypothetical protein